MSLAREASGQVGRRRALADTALGICNHDDRHALLLAGDAPLIRKFSCKNSMPLTINGPAMNTEFLPPEHFNSLQRGTLPGVLGIDVTTVAEEGLQATM